MARTRSTKPAAETTVVAECRKYPSLVVINGAQVVTFVGGKASLSAKDVELLTPFLDDYGISFSEPVAVEAPADPEPSAPSGSDDDNEADDAGSDSNPASDLL